jgi:hypothetical protein
MSDYASADELTEDKVTSNTEDIDLPSGKKVKVRGLSRKELLKYGQGTEDTALMERRMVSWCLIEPRMTERQVDAWQQGSGPKDGLDLVTAAIRNLSGLGEGAGKSNVAEARDGA